MRVIGYLRVSTTKQELFRQRDKITAFCDKEQHEIVEFIEDFGKSGASNSRMGYKRLMQLTSADCDILVISEISRLSRKEEITETLNDIQQILKKGISVLLLDNKDKIYQANEILPIQDVLLLIIQLYGAAQERNEIKRKNQEGKHALFKRNPMIVVDGHIPYGYRRVKDSKINRYVLEENPEEVDNIKKLFALILSGKTLFGASQYFNERGILFRGTPTYTSMLTGYLHNDLYRGIRRRIKKYGEENPDVVELRIPNPIIPEDDFLRAIEMVKHNCDSVSRSEIHFNVLKGILKCRCGRGMMVKNKRPKKGVDKFTYRCNCILPKNHPDYCTVGVDEIGYDLTNSIFTNLFKMRGKEIMDYFVTDGEQKIKEITEVLDAITLQIESKKNYLNQLDKAIENINQNIIKMASSTVLSTEIIATLNDQIKVENKRKEQCNNDIEVLSKKRTQKSIEKDELTKIIKRNVLYSLEGVSELDMSEVFHQSLESIVYYPFNIVKGTYVATFKTGRVERIIVNKVRNKAKAYLLRDDRTNINYKTGDITYHVMYLNRPNSINDFRLKEEEEYVVNMKDIFNDDNLEAIGIEIPIDISYRSKFLQQIHSIE